MKKKIMTMLVAATMGICAIAMATTTNGLSSYVSAYGYGNASGNAIWNGYGNASGNPTWNGYGNASGDAAKKDTNPEKNPEKTDDKAIGQKPTPTPTATPAPATPAETGKMIANKDSSDKATYKVISSSPANPEVAYLGIKNNSAAKITIPDTITDANGIVYTVTKIENDAFSGDKKLKSVTIGSNVKEIGSNSFKNCTSLKKVKVKSKVLEKIGASAFSGNKSLKSLDLSKTKIKKIGKNAFAGCKKLKTLKLNGNTIKTVNKKAFKNANKKLKISIYAKNRKTYNKIVKMIKKSGIKRFKFKKKK